MKEIISKYPFLKGHEEFVSIVLQIRKEFNCEVGHPIKSFIRLIIMNIKKLVK